MSENIEEIMEEEVVDIEKLVHHVTDYISERKYSELKDILIEMNAADVAELMEELPDKYSILVFRLLPKELASEVFVHIEGDTRELLITSFSDSELKEVLDDLYLDDTVDIIEEMPASVVKRILKHADPETRIEINKILKYPKDSAGSIMTTEYVDLRKDITVQDAFLRIRRTAVDKETIYTCYVKDDNRKLIGLVTVKELLMADYEDKIEDIMETNVIYVHTSDDREEVANMFSKYDFLAMPVVDAERRQIVQVDAVASCKRHPHLLRQRLAIDPVVTHIVTNIEAQLFDNGLQHGRRFDDDLLVGQAIVVLHARHVGNERHLGTRTHAGILVSGDHDKCRAMISLRFNIKINRRTAQTNKDGEDDPIA